MIRTYTPASVLTLPGTIAGLLDGYCGPVQRTDGAWWGEKWDSGRCATLEDPEWVRRLPLSRPEAMYRAACWLAEGRKCAECVGHEGKDKWQNRGISRSEAAALPALDMLGRDPCPKCDGTGYLRAPAPLWWALSPGPSTLPGWVCRAVIHASVVRVAAGLSAVREDVLTWSRDRCGWADPEGRLHTVDFLALNAGHALLETDYGGKETLRIDLPNTPAPAAPGGEQE